VVAAPATVISKVKEGGTLHWIPQASIANLDPIRNTAFVSRMVMTQIYDFPFVWDENLAAGDQMVGSWSLSSDALTYTFNLRDDLTFHDGTAVDSADVMASLLRWSTAVGTPAQIWALFGDPTLERVDNKTYKIKGTQPFGLFVNYSGQMPSYVMPKSVADTLEPEDVNTDYMASGPFKFVEWQPGARVVMEKFEQYVPRSDPKSGTAGARIVYLDTVEFIEVPDAATRVAALQTGQADFSEGVPNDFYQTLLDIDSLEVARVARWAKPMLAMNRTQPPLGDARSRLAIQAMTDQEEYLAAAYGAPELWELCASIYFCGSTWSSDAGAELYFAKPDLAKAQPLWDAAVEATGFDKKMVLLTNTDYADFYASALITKRVLEELGAEVDFVVTDWATVIARKVANLDKAVDDGGWHFYHSWDDVTSDPVQDYPTSPTWNGGYDNDRVQQLKLDFPKAKNFEEAKAIVDEIQRIFYEEDPPIIMYGSFNFLIAHQDYVKGYIPHKNIGVDSVWLDR
jgi:peptide/nickel transport system substrate-binding protein